MTGIIQKLHAIVGDKGLLTGDAVTSRTGNLWTGEALNAKAMVRPASTAEVSAVLACCNDAKQPVVPAGGLTGLVEGQQASAGEILLSLERMNTIEDMNETDRTMTVQGGAILEIVQQKAEAAGLMFPLDLGARASCTIGGNIATNAGGVRVVRYGMMRNLVLGLEAVLADGTVLDGMSGLIKNNTGYDLKHLFVGSEGTLGVVTRAVLRLHEALPGVGTAFLSVPTWDAVVALLRFFDSHVAGGVIAYEVMWRDYFELNTGDTSDVKSPFNDSVEFYVIVEIPLQDPEAGAHELEELLGTAMEDELIVDGIIPKSEQERQKLWEIRESFEPEKRRFDETHGFDVSLSTAIMNDYVETVRRNLADTAPQAKLFTMGHIGDNNIHFSVSDVAKEDMGPVNDIIYGPLKKIHGSVSAEHGIGLEKKSYLCISRTDEELKMMRGIKRLFDPNNILNPG
ncbi:MAG: FAD-binding oxidoreductase, partial [Rhodospirillales bacterium]|nr:FAD-binding oxidoreductase [Rhodospirillales bacterium]